MVLPIEYTQMSMDVNWLPGTYLRLRDHGQIDKDYRAHLLSLGLTQGVVIKVIRKAPLGNPIQIELRGVMLALRREDLDALNWDVV